ncbi:MAG: sulfatase [Bacteroidia bacterium]
MGLSLAIACTKPADTASRAFRNIVVIIGDDHAAGVLGCYGNDRVQTPHLDRLATSGVRFDRAYCQSPLCSASRQSLLTGRYPYAAGVTLLFTSFPDSQHTIADHLGAQGFASALIGKHHFNNQGLHGFDTVISQPAYQQYLQAQAVAPLPDSIAVRPPWRPFKDPARIWLNADVLPGSYPDAHARGTFYAREAIRFMEAHQDQRFLLWLAFNEPHSPFDFPVEYRGSYDPADMPLPAGSAEDSAWIPAVFRDLTEAERQGIVASYYTSVSYLDKNIGLVLDQLDALGLADSTLVIYIGDHGYLLNDHLRFEKHMMWEEAVRAPLLIRGGSRYGQGRAIDNLVEYVDLVPTMLQAAGVPAMPTAQGKSLLPLLQGAGAGHKEYVFAVYLVDNKAMIRTRAWKYIFSTGKYDLGGGYATGNPPTGIRHRLYDLHNDPGETHDVSALPAYADVLGEMQALMVDHFRQTDSRAAVIAADAPVEVQLAAFCEPPEGESPRER